MDWNEFMEICILEKFTVLSHSHLEDLQGSGADIKHWSADALLSSVTVTFYLAKHREGKKNDDD